MSWPCTQSTPSLLENRTSSASSIDTSAACGRGSAIRARPSRLMSRPSPICTPTTAMPSTSAKLLNDMPAANQNVPRCIGKYEPSWRSWVIGSAGEAAMSSAWISG